MKPIWIFGPIAAWFITVLIHGLYRAAKDTEPI